MNHADVIAEMREAGHDVSVLVKHFAADAERQAQQTRIENCTVGELATIIDEALERRLKFVRDDLLLAQMHSQHPVSTAATLFC